MNEALFAALLPVICADLAGMIAEEGEYGVYDDLRQGYGVLHTTGEPYINHDIDCCIAARSGV